MWITKKGKDAMERLTSDSSQMDGARQLLGLQNYEVDADAVAVAIIARLRAERVWFVRIADTERVRKSKDLGYG